MTSSICTLFEGSYHFGVASMANSLYNQGYKGSIYAGYRGPLPSWAISARENTSFQWENSKTLQLTNDFQIHFLPLDTTYHLTNFKPDFMLKLFEGPASNSEALFYFDPDIVISAPWSFFCEWVGCGIALCEDVNSPLAHNHPRRVAWRNYFGGKQIKLTFKDCIYVNGGFVGVSKENIGFLSMWKTLQIAMEPVIGGLNRSSLSGAQLPPEARGPFAPFGKTDQDALNAAIEAWEDEYSFIGKEAMAFKPGLAVMPHALGLPKPWQWRPIGMAIFGMPPRLVDREYWKSANALIKTHSSSFIIFRKVCINFAAFLGRFYKRNGNSAY